MLKHPESLSFNKSSTRPAATEKDLGLFTAEPNLFLEFYLIFCYFILRKFENRNKTHVMQIYTTHNLAEEVKFQEFFKFTRASYRNKNLKNFCSLSNSNFKSIFCQVLGISPWANDAFRLQHKSSVFGDKLLF